MNDEPGLLPPAPRAATRAAYEEQPPSVGNHGATRPTEVQPKRPLIKPRKLYGPTAVITLSTIIAFLLAVIIVLVYALLSVMPETPTGRIVRVPPPAGCYATVGTVHKRITAEQALNVSVIVGESLRRDLPARAASIALTTAWQESTLRNLDWGDLDSLGLFQQRPSMGWGTPEQILDPWYSSGKFYDVLVTIPGWEEADITETAQEVQRSGYPEAYRKHEIYARAWASALTGWSSNAVSCLTNTPPTGNAAALTEFFHHIYGNDLPIEVSGNTMRIIGDNEIDTWAIAQLAVVRSTTDGVIAVTVRGRAWTNDEWHVAPWLPDHSEDEGGATNLVVITLQP